MGKRSILYFVFIIILISLSFFLSIFSFGVDMVGVLGFGIIFVIIIAVIVLFVFKSIRDGEVYLLELFLSFVLLMGVCGVYVCSNNYIKQREQISIQEGNKIVNAVDTYFADMGRYPKKLDELIPKYLKEIPKSKVFIYEDEFFYLYRAERNEYQISFRKPAQTIYKYDSQSKKWYNAD